MTRASASASIIGMPEPRAKLAPRLRVTLGSEIALGPGKAELLGLIASKGSIRAAALQMDMSYNRAWTLVREMNGLFRKPLVVSLRGGGTGGGATLTPTGARVLRLYGIMERDCHRAVEREWKSLRALLRTLA